MTEETKKIVEKWRKSSFIGKEKEGSEKEEYIALTLDSIIKFYGYDDPNRAILDASIQGYNCSILMPIAMRILEKVNRPLDVKELVEVFNVITLRDIFTTMLSFKSVCKDKDLAKRIKTMNDISRFYGMWKKTPQDFLHFVLFGMGRHDKDLLTAAGAHIDFESYIVAIVSEYFVLVTNK